MEKPYRSVLADREPIFNSLGYSLEFVSEDVAELISDTLTLRIAIEPHELHPSVNLINESGAKFAFHIAQNIVAPKEYLSDLEVLKVYSNRNNLNVAVNFEKYVAMQIDMLIQFIESTLPTIDLEGKLFTKLYNERNRGLT